MTVQVSYKGGPINGRVHISGSKSISNRALILNALSVTPQVISNLSDSDDTQALQRLLSQSDGVFDAHHAGTTFRFMTAYSAMHSGEQVLTGSEQMQQRPIGPLVEALNEIGAAITYQNAKGYPPLKIGAFGSQKKREITVQADISSQFLSALCMIAPTLPEGLVIKLAGALVSEPYLLMTLQMMASFGVVSSYVDNTIVIQSQIYKSIAYAVESDWSSAGYLFAIAALAQDSEIILSHFSNAGLQADAKIMEFCHQFGVEATLSSDKTLRLRSSDRFASSIDHNFITHPDLTQTIAVICAAKGISIKYSGLKTLYIKETNRVEALKIELNKVGVTMTESEDAAFEIEQKGKAYIQEPTFDTYQDHRMAMCLAPLGIIGPITMRNPEVVSKSYPNYWRDLEQLGFSLDWSS